MYLAALAPLFSLVSTYFIEILEGVGGGGPPTKHTQRKTKNTNKKTTTSNAAALWNHSRIPLEWNVCIVGSDVLSQPPRWNLDSLAVLMSPIPSNQSVVAHDGLREPCYSPVNLDLVGLR